MGKAGEYHLLLRTTGLKLNNVPNPQEYRLAAFYTLPTHSFLLWGRHHLATSCKVERSVITFFYVDKLREAYAFLVHVYVL